MPDFKKITKILERMKGEERFVIVEKGEPRWVVLSMADYEKLKEDCRQCAAAKTEEELPSFQEESDEEDAWSQEEEKEEEPEFYFESLEDEEEDFGNQGDLSQARKEEGRGREWNDIPF